jgi:hypothetical protein
MLDTASLTLVGRVLLGLPCRKKAAVGGGTLFGVSRGRQQGT